MAMGPVARSPTTASMSGTPRKAWFPPVAAWACEPATARPARPRVAVSTATATKTARPEARRAAKKRGSKARPSGWRASMLVMSAGSARLKA